MVKINKVLNKALRLSLIFVPLIIITIGYVVLFDQTDANAAIRYAHQFPGADAGEKIQAALADLPTTGGVVDARGLEGNQVISIQLNLNKANTKLLLGEATYSLSAGIRISANNVTIEGLGPGATILKVNAQSITAIDTPSPSSLGGIIITDLEIDGNRANIAFPLDDLTGHGIRFDGVTHSHVMRTFIHDTVFMGINFYYSDDNIIGWNRLENIGKTGIPPGTSAFYGIYIEYSNSRNKIVFNRLAGVREEAIRIRTGPNTQNEENLILGNHIGSAVDGVRLVEDLGSNGILRGTIIAQNNILNITEVGIRVSNTVASNQIVDTSIMDNIIINCGVHGIDISATAGAVKRTKVIGNTIRDCTGVYSRAISLGVGAENSLVSGNISYNNTNHIINDGASSLIYGNRQDDNSDLRLWGDVRQTQGTALKQDNTSGTPLRLFTVDGSDRMRLNPDGNMLYFGNLTGGVFLPLATGEDLGSGTNRWNASLESVTVYNSLSPNISGNSLGSSTNQWRVYTQVVATGSLPPAGPSMDGVLIIEDAGGEDRNLIIYGGGQRFRIDGKQSF
ncbi:MAG: right-handed parallel beta-helix repeat-containing protein [Planctomycetes bacterium]|nr:right-handed parallel beta-helix repeat-containing protein [Planctomycetota bacterium]